MSNSTWKQRERNIAKLFRTKRVPLSGSNSGHNTSSDTMHQNYYVEQKHRKRHTTWTLFRDTREKAKKEDKIPIITLTEHNQAGCLVVIHSDDLETFCNLEKREIDDVTEREAIEKDATE